MGDAKCNGGLRKVTGRDFGGYGGSETYTACCWWSSCVVLMGVVL